MDKIFVIKLTDDQTKGEKNHQEVLQAALEYAISHLGAWAYSFEEVKKPIKIEVMGGVVDTVQNVPTGMTYEIADYDNE